jgi:hypothetical protein
MERPSSGALTEVPMLRKLILVACAVAFTLASCGRQVTPNRTSSPTGLGPGQMQIQFQTQGQADFVDNWYVLAFNTSGTGTEPYAINGNQAQNWFNFSFEIVIFQPNVNSAIQYQVWQFVSTQGPNGPLKQPFRLGPYTPQQIYITPSCGSINQFCVTFNRDIFVTTFCPQSPSPSPTTSGTPTPTSSPTGSPSPSPVPSSACVADNWFINWFVASPTGTPAGQVIAAAGPFGTTDTTFVQQYNVLQNFASPWTQGLPPAVPQAPSVASQITGGEVLNVP